MEDEKAKKKQLKKEEKLAKLKEKLARLENKTIPTPSAAPKKAPKPARADGYDPAPVEARWVSYWKEHQSFLPRNSPHGKIFSMCIPPPNVTGSLHIGHAMMIAIEDCIARYKRLTGHEVLYLPGLDHAGIATQNVVGRNLPPGLSRDELLQEAHKWSTRYGDRICEQFDRMGCSVDYSRKVFTLDPRMSRSVNRAFVELHRRGLIYRENKLVNWSGKMGTTLSDLEVDFKDVKGGTYLEVDGGRFKFGIMYYIRYFLASSRDGPPSSAYVIVGTTRPETILGDTALCANPSDPRFSDVDGILSTGEFPDPFNEEFKLISRFESINEEDKSINEELKTERKNKYKLNHSASNKTVTIKQNKKLFAVNPVTGERIPVIFDTRAELGFGTGILKVTPAHDPVDYQIGKTHGLETVKIFTEGNTIAADGPYKGERRFEARLKIVKHLRESGALLKEEAHDQILPVCSRSGDIVEPMLKEQWWVKCAGMAARAAEAVRSGEIRLEPVEAHATWFRWLEGIRDWCLSRQLWWGHRVPAYRAFHPDGSFEWIVAEDTETARKEAQSRGCIRVEQDEDVLDTWFSSGLWPFATLGWPDNTSDLARYFPTSLLETGSDILFFWVARMVMLSYELCGTRPFDTILLHGIVRDSHGRKMSKSLGNVIDPIHVIEGISLQEMIAGLSRGNLDPREVVRATDALRRDFPTGIPKCGADALRFALLSYMNGAKDINLDVLRVQGYSRLCNKLYHASRFVSSMCAGKTATHESADTHATPSLVLELSLHRWIFSRLNACIAEIHRHFEEFNFMMATQAIHSFFLYDFCDIFIEAIKGDVEGATSEGNPTSSPSNADVLWVVFKAILELFNPFMPFITEELHFTLYGSCVTGFPTLYDGSLSNDFEDIIKVSKLCRRKRIQLVGNSEPAGLRNLLRGEIEMVGEIDGYEQCGSLKYKVIE